MVSTFTDLQKFLDDRDAVFAAEYTHLKSERDAAVANEAAAKAALADATTERDALKQQVASLNTQVTALNAEVARLKALVDGGETAQKTLVGAWSTRHSGETLTQSFARFERTCGRVEVARVYDSGQGPAKVLGEARLAGLGTRAIVPSFKLSPVEVVKGTYDAAIKSVVQSFSTERKGHNIYLTYEHECDSKVQKGHYTAEQFRAAFTHVSRIIRSVGDPGIKVTLILTGYQFDTRINNFYVKDATDVVAVDPYSHSINMDAEGLIRNFKMLDWFTANKVTWGVAEIGQHADDVASHVALVKSYAKLINLGAEFICHFNSVVPNDTTGILDDFEIDNKPETAAAFKALPRATA